ncbi:cytochrome C [Pelagibacterium sp.]|uniref:cytochrome C n=1 Tax=Pelagibacterium sp. TaxID=1967288 RepID=UPI003A8F5B25
MHALILRTGMLLAILGVIPNAAWAQQSEPDVSIVEQWLGSQHADAQSPSFRHWEGERAVPGTCAMCHSGEGFRDYHGFDGSVSGSIEGSIAPGGVVDCATCHSDGAAAMESVEFPSGMNIDHPGSSATCLSCHQGRQSGGAVAAATGGIEDDTVDPELSFINPHYAVAAATLYGSQVGGGYQYPGKSYMTRFEHVARFSTCTDCHDPHTLEVPIETCARCHDTLSPRAIRTSEVDFDGDGDITTGIHAEIDRLKTMLLDAIENYSIEVSGEQIAYVERYPYFMFAEGETEAGSPYAAWTPRLLRASYNFAFVTADPGAYAHNPHYALQLLHDSIMDLSAATGKQVEIGERPR